MACSGVAYDAGLTAEDVLEYVAGGLFKTSKELENLLEEGEKIYKITVMVEEIKEIDDE